MSNDPGLPPQSPRPSGDVLAIVGSTLGKGVLYALAFWAVYAFVYTPAYYAMHRADADVSSEEQTQRQMRAWDEQSQRSAAMLEDSAALQKRYEALLARQEQQVERMDAILGAWERQSGVRN